MVVKMDDRQRKTNDRRLKKIREKRNRERQAKLEYGLAIGAGIC